MVYRGADKLQRQKIWIFVYPIYNHNWRNIITIYTGCPRRNGQNFGRVFLMLNYTDITQNTYIQSWTVTEIMAIEKCGLRGCLRTVLRPWRHTHPLRMPGNQTSLASIVMQWPWRDNNSCGLRKLLGNLRTNTTVVRVFLYFNLMALCHSPWIYNIYLGCKKQWQPCKYFLWLSFRWTSVMED